MRSHPHVWKFIAELKELESNQEVRLYQLDKDKLVEKSRNKIDIERDIAILKLKNKYARKEIDLALYLNSLSSYMPEL
jgi:hypothetical protein